MSETTRVRIVRGTDYRYHRPPSVTARGTERDVRPLSTAEAIGDAWHWSLWCEQLARNLSVGAALDLAYRCGLADGEIACARRADALRRARDRQ